MHVYSLYEIHDPIPRRQILDSTKLKDFADDNFRFDENDRKLSKWVENTVGKGESARYEQFLLFPQYFQKACSPGASKGVMGGNGLLCHIWNCTLLCIDTDTLLSCVLFYPVQCIYFRQEKLQV